MKVKTVHTGCGITLDKLKEEIGWDVNVADDLADTEPPADEGLRIYCEKIVAERRGLPSSSRKRRK